MRAFSSKGIYMESALSTIYEYARLLGSFTREQAYHMRPDIPKERIDKAIAALKSNDYRLIFERGEGQFTVNPSVSFDHDMVRAAWPMLLHKEGEILDNENSDFYIASSPGPAKLSYFLHDTLYDVVLLTEKNRAVLSFIDKLYEAEGEAMCGPHKCIFVIEGRELLDRLPRIRIPHLFAIVDEKNLPSVVTFFEDSEGYDYE